MTDNVWDGPLNEPPPDDQHHDAVNNTADDHLVAWGDLAGPALDALETAGQQQGLAGLPSGFTELDRATQGFQRGRLAVVAGLSGAGKSVLLGDIFRTWMRLRIPSVLVTLEMGRDEVWLRQAAAACRIPHDRLKAGNLSDDDWSRLAKWVGDTSEAPSWVCDKPRVTLAELSELVHRGVEQHGWQGVLVDYAQIIRHKAGTREREVAEVASGLKELARTANVALVVGAQLNREVTKRTGGVPKLADLRESAALEHETDVAILVHRPDYDDKESPRAGEADLIIAKNRSGPKDTITVAAQMHYQRFVQLIEDSAVACSVCHTNLVEVHGMWCAECADPQQVLA